MDKQGYKTQLVTELSQRVGQAAMSGQLTRTAKPQPIAIKYRKAIVGYRFGAIELDAGLDSGRLLRALSRDDCAVFRTLIPWDFPSSPAVYMKGPRVRAEAAWPPDLSDQVVRLWDANKRPDDPSRWLGGKSEAGGDIKPSLCDVTPHWLIAGTTGSGKSVAMRSAVLQLAQSPKNHIALVDGKFSEGLGPVSHLPGIVGPVATDLPQAKTVLTWACAQMRTRYEKGWDGGKLVLAIDEFQTFSDDTGFTDMLRRLTSQGRAAGVHCLLGTQHPDLRVAFGGDVTARRNVVGRIVLKAADYEASKVATGSSAIRADLLLSCGDSYIITPGSAHRAQLFLVDNEDFAKVGTGEWEISDWGEVDIAPEDVGQELPTPARGVKKCFAPAQVGAALIAATNDDGRPTFERWLDDHGVAKPGGHGLYKLHRFGKVLHNWLEDHDYGLTFLGEIEADGQADDDEEWSY